MGHHRSVDLWLTSRIATAETCTRQGVRRRDGACREGRRPTPAAPLPSSTTNELFRVGRRSLAIGIPILVACFISARLAAGYLSENPVLRLVEESLLILGWVANWRPLEIFLYDW